jgi:hypothetical protein
MGDTWADFVSPFSLLAPFVNVVLWLGLAFAPVTLPRWWRWRGRRWVAGMAAAPASRKTIWMMAVAGVLVVPPLLGDLLTTRHSITLRNQSQVPLEGVALGIGGTSHSFGPMAPDQQRTLDVEQGITTPYVFSRREGRDRIELGRCDHTNGRLNRYLVTISGEKADHVACVALSP